MPPPGQDQVQPPLGRARPPLLRRQGTASPEQCQKGRAGLLQPSRLDHETEDRGHRPAGKDLQGLASRPALPGAAGPVVEEQRRQLPTIVVLPLPAPEREPPPARRPPPCGCQTTPRRRRHNPSRAAPRLGSPATEEHAIPSVPDLPPRRHDQAPAEEREACRSPPAPPRARPTVRARESEPRRRTRPHGAAASRRSRRATGPDRKCCHPAARPPARRRRARRWRRPAAAACRSPSSSRYRNASAKPSRPSANATGPCLRSWHSSKRSGRPSQQLPGGLRRARKDGRGSARRPGRSRARLRARARPPRTAARAATPRGPRTSRSGLGPRSIDLHQRALDDRDARRLHGHHGARDVHLHPGQLDGGALHRHLPGLDVQRGRLDLVGAPRLLGVLAAHLEGTVSPNRGRVGARHLGLPLAADLLLL